MKTQKRTTKFLTCLTLVLATILLIILPYTVSAEAFPFTVSDEWNFLGKEESIMYDPKNLIYQYAHETYENNLFEKPRMIYSNYFFSQEIYGDNYIAAVSCVSMDPNFLPQDHYDQIMRSQRCFITSSITNAEEKKIFFGLFKTYNDLGTAGGDFISGSPTATQSTTTIQVGGSIGAGAQGSVSDGNFSGGLGINGSFSTSVTKSKPSLIIANDLRYNGNHVNGFNVEYGYYKPNANDNSFARSVTFLMYLSVYRCVGSADNWYCITMGYQPEFFYDRPGITNIRVWGHIGRSYYVQPSGGFKKGSDFTYSDQLPAHIDVM